MAEVRRMDYEEFFAEFISIRGSRGSVLVFVDSDDEAASTMLADDIAKIVDEETSIAQVVTSDTVLLHGQLVPGSHPPQYVYEIPATINPTKIFLTFKTE